MNFIINTITILHFIVQQVVQKSTLKMIINTLSPAKYRKNKIKEISHVRQDKTVKKLQHPRNFSATKKRTPSIELRPRKKTIEEQTGYKISTDHLSLLIQDKKIAEMKQIHESQALYKYYTSLKTLFMMIYGASQIIYTNLFNCKKQVTGLGGIKFVGIFFQIYDTIWNQKNMIKLKILAKNFIRMSPSVVQFQRKIQFVCRKITLNKDKKDKIEHAFLNQQIQKFWESTSQKMFFQSDLQVLKDLFQTPSQKLSYWDFYELMNNQLCSEQFYQQLKIHTSNKRRNMNHNLDFTFQFVLIERICYRQHIVNQKNSLKSYCEIY